MLQAPQSRKNPCPKDSTKERQAWAVPIWAISSCSDEEQLCSPVLSQLTTAAEEGDQRLFRATKLMLGVELADASKINTLEFKP